MKTYGKCMYRSMASWPRYLLQLSCDLYVLAVLTQDKEPKVPM
jgi:hypothetical protein